MPEIAGTPVARSRSRLANAARLGTPADVIEAKRDHAAEKLAAYVERVLADAPPLTPEQRVRIGTLLRLAAEARQS